MPLIVLDFGTRRKHAAAISLLKENLHYDTIKNVVVHVFSEFWDLIAVNILFFQKLSILILSEIN